MAIALPWLDAESLDFPDPDTALPSPNGLLAVGGDLRPERLLRAYQAGIFPWFEEDQPILWWSPDPRMVLFPHEVHVSHSMRRFLRKSSWRVRSDTAFEAVIRACAGAREGSHGTWLTEAMIAAYLALHHAGHAHSVEVWDEEELVGGLYGIAMGGVFFGESMFSRRSNASKMALIDLATRGAADGFRVIDCQVANPHLASLGARNIPRKTFRSLLPRAGDIGSVAVWPYNRNNPITEAVPRP